MTDATMSKRVADAIHIRVYDLLTVEQRRAIDLKSIAWLDVASTAIEEMREQTEAMINAALEADMDPESQWSANIDAALL